MKTNPCSTLHSYNNKACQYNLYHRCIACKLCVSVWGMFWHPCVVDPIIFCNLFWEQRRHFLCEHFASFFLCTFAAHKSVFFSCQTYNDILSYYSSNKIYGHEHLCIIIYILFSIFFCFFFLFIFFLFSIFFIVILHKQVTVATQTGHECPDHSFNPDKMTMDKHCYECKVRYRDPKPQDLVMYLHAWKYRVCIQPSYFFSTILKSNIVS